MRTRGDGRIFQRKGSAFWWCAYYLRGKEYRESTGETEGKKAQKFLGRKLKEVHADQIGAKQFITPRQEKVRVSELLEALQGDYELRGKDSAQFRSHLKHIRAHFGDTLAVALTAEQVDVYVRECREESKPATVNRRTQLLRQAYKLAIQ